MSQQGAAGSGPPTGHQHPGYGAQPGSATAAVAAPGRMGDAYYSEGGAAEAAAYAAEGGAGYGSAAMDAEGGAAAEGQQEYYQYPAGSADAADAAAAAEASAVAAAPVGNEVGEAAVAATDEGAYSPAAYLQQLEEHLGSLQQQRRDLQQQLATAAAGAYQEMSARLGTASTGVPLPSELPALADELVVLQSVRQYLAYVQVGRVPPMEGAGQRGGGLMLRRPPVLLWPCGGHARLPGRLLASCAALRHARSACTSCSFAALRRSCKR